MGSVVIDYYLEILYGNNILDSINLTNIVFIPKITCLNNMNSFRPISLCNVIYKLIAKTIANHFQWVLEGCADVAQSAFLLGRLITINILVAHEVLHAFKFKRKGKKGHLALKVNMSKASHMTV